MIRHLISILKDSSNSFDDQESGEKVILLLRRHLFVIIAPLVLFFLACLLPIFAGVMFGSVLKQAGVINLFLFVSGLWYMILWLAMFFALTMYSLNTVIITDRRIVENKQFGFFDRKISELHSHRIQDVATRTNGVIETLLKFGDITVQTAGSEQQFIFNQIPNPDKVKDTIMHIAANHVYTEQARGVHNSSV